MAERNLGTMDRCRQSHKKLRNSVLASEGGHRYWGTDGGNKLMTCCVRTERDTSFQLETLKTSLF